MAIFPSYHVPLKLTMPHTVITKRGKKPMRTGPGHRCPHASTAPVNPDYGRLCSDTEPSSKGELLFRSQKNKDNHLVH